MAKAAIWGARRQVNHPRSPTSRSAVMRAEVIMPRSPTMVRRSSAKRFRMVSTIAMKALGSAVLPLKTSMATGRPSLSVKSPYSIWAMPRRLSRE